jgi:hypothetical protein
VENFTQENEVDGETFDWHHVMNETIECVCKCHQITGNVNFAILFGNDETNRCTGRHRKPTAKVQPVSWAVSIILNSVPTLCDRYWVALRLSTHHRHIPDVRMCCFTDRGAMFLNGHEQTSVSTANVNAGQWRLQRICLVLVVTGTERISC